MKRTILFHKFALIVSLVLVTAVTPAWSQSVSGSPKQEKLLNGLKVLMWPDAKADKSRVRLRVHSGSAFDPLGKEGVMKMLAQALFPTEASREFFVEDLEGSLEVVTTYDYLEINASSKPDAFMTMLETIATAVSNPSIDKENTARLQSVTLERIKKLSSDPDYAADSAIANRLFGQHPYGRAIDGTISSVQKLVFADLLDAEQRFLTADNATLAISGNFNREQAFKAVRRLFGSWVKADRKVPSTFRQPDAPDQVVLTTNSPQAGVVRHRIAVKGTARGQKELASSFVLATVLRSRIQKILPASFSDHVYVRSEPHILPGSIVIAIQSPPNSSEKIVIKNMIGRVLKEPISDAEFTTAKQMSRSEWASRDLVTSWLDIDTFKLSNVDVEMGYLESLTLGDLQLYADLVRSLPSASIMISPAASN
jgi:predicted Zn-dependent peptidase